MYLYAVNPSRPMRARWARMSSVVSLGLNLFLLVWLLWPSAQERSASKRNEGPSKATEAGPVEPRSSNLPRGQTPEPETAWTRMVSTNFLEFAARLRESGCPEMTVCDILVPQIEDRFARLKDDADYRGDFWALGDERRRLERQSAEELGRWERLEQELLDGLGCSNPVDGLDGQREFEVVVSLIAGLLGRERLSQAIRVISQE